MGHTSESVWQNYLQPTQFISERHVGQGKVFVSAVDPASEELVERLRHSDSKHKSLDKSVLFAIAASRQAIEKAGWKGKEFGINLGSSRGATELFERHHSEFLKTGHTQTLSSPTTTLGNISSWVANDLQSTGPEISHSITCSTALHAVLNGVAWIQAGMADQFLVGGSEAPLTAFTIAQMQAMKIYTKGGDYPCRSMDFAKKRNSMALGEGAAVICIESGQNPKALGYIEGIGYATEILEHSVSISAEGTCFQRSMAMALSGMSLSDVDVIVMHAPGTIAGDLAELNAIKHVFGENLPALTSNKWKIGHTFGASGMFSIEMAIMMMRHQMFISVPFAEAQPQPQSLKKILVNAVGFGGNAVSILLSNS